MISGSNVSKASKERVLPRPDKRPKRGNLRSSSENKELFSKLREENPIIFQELVRATIGQ